MLILIIMAVGVLIGARFFPQKYKKWNTGFQTVCTGALIFCMGVSLGQRPNFLQDLKTLGWQSFLFAAIPIGLSILVVYILSKAFLEKKSKDVRP